MCPIIEVKASALLYEITERTNKLAQPRLRSDGLVEDKSKVYNTSLIPKASPRIIQLAKPRVFYHSPVKKLGYVSPGALTAIATQRIIELSKPKKKRRVKGSKKRKPTSYKEKSSRYV
ncbi:uncharacterized protein LOC108624862 [Ceratina calcarata]|uniref:Uncharacterized protein LOC108624862 n=1 Tax=Ceratina calcarata TaxID=156304 RepID=A0AAJ7S1L4_9HYME|nr:uncharacterized protein LOC108624862 [Ceratina calcarata]